MAANSCLDIYNLIQNLINLKRLFSECRVHKKVITQPVINIFLLKDAPLNTDRAFQKKLNFHGKSPNGILFFCFLIAGHIIIYQIPKFNKL